MRKQPPKQPTVPLMPRTCSPVVVNRPEPENKLPKKESDEHFDGTIPLILDDKIIGVCKKIVNGYIECIIWDRHLAYEHMPDKNNVADSVVINVNMEIHE